MASDKSEGSVHTERIKVKGDEPLHKVKELAAEGNVRRLPIISEEGMTLIEIPLTYGVVGAVTLPALAAVGALAALVTECTIENERIDEAEEA
jgi:CBS domain-containing protein